MPETRYVEEYKDGKLINKVPYEVSDEKLAEEAETKDLLEKADALIDSDPKAFLKRLVRRLIKNGALP